MKYIIITIGIVLFVAVLWNVLLPKLLKPSSIENKRAVSQNSQNGDTTNSSLTTIIAENLDTPWGIAFLPASPDSGQGGPDNSMLVTERQGTVRLVTNSGSPEANPIATLQSVKEIGEGGLLGIAVHPDFAKNNYVYLYYTYSSTGNNTLNRVVRMTFTNQQLSNEQIIVDRIPGASNHNGGRIKFGPDGNLYIGTGDAQEPSLAQDKNSLAGKILRVSDEGKAVTGNSLVFSYGHRNVQGLAWDSSGKLWATEHGRSGVASGYDELNLIENGKNYGWPDFEGDESGSGIVTPKRHSGATNTWAPAGMAFTNNSLFFAGLRGQALYQAEIQNDSVIDVKEHFKGEFGRIRDVVTGPDGMLYITTSDKDGRGSVEPGDDKIIRVNPQKL